MKITLFTTNNIRHNYFVNTLSKIADELYVVQENKKSLKENLNSKIMKDYFEEVNKAQLKFFGDLKVKNFSKNVKLLAIPFGELNNCSLQYLSDYLKSDVYIVFGSSYIKGELVDYLINKKTFNIHMGVSPYYRGTDCNFWALYDGNPHLVGATIHMLSKGLDSGSILYHAMSNIKTSPYEYTMSTVKSAFRSLTERIKDKSLFKIKSIKQDKSKEIRYSKKDDFNQEVLKNYNKKKIDLNIMPDSNFYLKDPFYLDE